MGSSRNLAKNYAKGKATLASKSIFFKLGSIIFTPTIIITLFIFIILIGLASQTQKEIVSIGLAAEDLGEENELTGDLNLGKGKATYVGVDDTDTPHSRAVLAQLRPYSNLRNPYYNGYRNLCEGWCNDIYRRAGLPYDGACCAYTHSVRNATKTGKIPKGAIVYSGYKRDGTFYENGHATGCKCTVCGNWAGHVGIYAGDGIIVGSQIPYAMSVDAWIDLCGYGGWSLR